MITKEQISVYENINERLYVMAAEYIMAFMTGRGCGDVSITASTIEDGSICIKTESYWLGGDTESNEYIVPLSYLNDDKWIEKVRTEKNLLKRIKEQKQAEESKKEQLKKDKEEYETYLLLEQKFKK